MPIKNVIQVSEFEKLYYDDRKPFKQKHWEALCRYLEQQNRNEDKRIEYFRILKNGIQFTNFVGVIQAGSLTIEILPKVDKGSTTAANQDLTELESNEFEQKQQWHNVLLQMLKECRFLKVNHVDYANLNLRSNSILDIYIELFLTETERLLHEGLLKKYQKKEGNQTALKGQLLFAKQIAQNIAHQERFSVRYSQYNRDNIYNVILYKTLSLIPSISNNVHLLDKAGRLRLDFPEVANCNVNEDTFNKLQFDRKTERYKEALLISKMLLLNYRPDITGGLENVIAILFDMNKLWEEFVYRRLKKEEAVYNIRVLRQQSKDFWLKETGVKSQKIRPDIVINYNYAIEGDTTVEKTLIVDTKWKNNDDLNPSDEDLKQMFVYNLYWKCEKSILLFPTNVPKSLSGSYYSHLIGGKMDKECRLLTVSVLKEKKLNIDLGNELMEIIFSDINIIRKPS
jgi:5-methylcytosine-specific restriction enzyme subunit McrC